MITKSAQKRYNILCFWKKHGIQATTDAYGVKRSTLYFWDKLYRDGGKRIKALNPKSTALNNKRKRQVDYRIVEEIKRLRLRVCSNLGKDKIKPFLDEFCFKQGLKTISSSTNRQRVRISSTFS
jgi:transposase-like protein